MFQLLGILTAISTIASTKPAAEPPRLQREFRGVWVATVANIDWPSKPGLTTEQQKAELIAIFNKAADLNLNAVVFQVRPMADALYPSKLEPWSEYLTGAIGQAPSPTWDPLAFAIDEAHSRGMELHAWFNPYRARHPSAKSPASNNHITKTDPTLAKPYGTHYWMNPTNPEVQKRSLAVILDVVKRYNVDGVHMDDYFYPYQEKDDTGQLIPFPDDDTWTVYQKSGGKLSRADWRRDAVNSFIKNLYSEVKAEKPWVKVGLSPFGIWQPGYPKGIEGFNQYESLYADAKLWLNEGWIDYFTPQLYWPIAQEKQSFPKLLAWWASENTKQRSLWPGVYTSKHSAQEIADQIALVRKQPGSNGVIHFSMKALMNNTDGIADTLKKVYAKPALVPAMPWLAKDKAPAKPSVDWVTTNDGPAIAVDIDAEMRLVLIHVLKGKWTTEIRGVTFKEDRILYKPTANTEKLMISSVDRLGRESERIEVELKKQ